MAELKQNQSGLLASLRGGQAISSDWMITDPERVSVLSNCIRLIKGNTPLQVLFNRVLHTAVIDARCSFTPGQSDAAGITLYENDNNRLDLSEVYEETDVSLSYNYLRLVKNGATCAAYTSENGSAWYFIGSSLTDFDGYLGVFNASQTADCDLYAVNIFEGFSVEVTGLSTGYRASLCTSEGSVIKSVTVTNDTAKFDLSDGPMPFVGYIRVGDAKGNLIAQTPVQEFWGGDSYSLADSLPMTIEGIELRKEHWFGNLPGATVDYHLTATNTLGRDLANVVFGIVEDPDKFGYTWASLATYNPDTGNVGVFRDSITYSNLAIGQTVHLMLRIKRQAEPIRPPAECSFLLTVQAD